MLPGMETSEISTSQVKISSIETMGWVSEPLPSWVPDLSKTQPDLDHDPLSS